MRTRFALLMLLALVPAARPGDDAGLPGGEGPVGPVLVDCNDNGLDDADEILAGLASDANGNAIPDECETCQVDLGFGGPGNVTLWVCGDVLTEPGGLATISMQGAVPFAPLFLVVGITNAPTPVKGGILVPVPPLILMGGLFAGADGTLAFGVGGGGRLPATLYVQYVAINSLATPDAPVYEFSNAVELVLGL